MAKQQVTLNKIVDVRGTVYGPGTIEVPKEIADILVNHYDGVPGAIITDDVAELMKLPADQLTPEQLQQVLEAKGGGKKPSTGRGKQEATTAQTPPAPPAPPVQSEAGQKAEGDGGKEVQPGELPAGFPAREKLVAAGVTTVAQLRGLTGELEIILDQAERDQVNAELALLEQ
jgi:hypothetical protein